MGYFASQLTIPFSKANEWVKLSYQVEKEELQLAQGKTLDEIDQTERSMIWRNEARITRDELMTKAASIQGKFYWGTWALGIWVGIVICAKLFSLSIFRKRDEYEAHRGSCYACGRCYDYCPGSNGVPIQFETGGHLRNDK